MHVYRCELTLMEATFFSSREVSATYQTEPLIGNIALAYAFGFCQSPYFNDGTIHYKAHLSALNERGVYVTPATLVGEPSFTIGQFNAQPDTYWYAMGAGTLVTRPDDGWALGAGKTWRIVRADGTRSKLAAESRPQYGRIRFLAIGNRAVSYVLSREPLEMPRYVRLGKFMSKARVAVEEVAVEEVEREEVVIPFLLNPADLPPDMPPAVFDLISVPPTPLVRNARLSGRFYRLKDGMLVSSQKVGANPCGCPPGQVQNLPLPQDIEKIRMLLPAGMRFGVEGLP
jgi:CRISPR-associated protein Csc1